MAKRTSKRIRRTRRASAGHRNGAGTLTVGNIPTADVLAAARIQVEITSGQAGWGGKVGPVIVCDGFLGYSSPARINAVEIYRETVTNNHTGTK